MFAKSQLRLCPIFLSLLIFLDLLKKSFLLCSFFCFFNIHSMEVAAATVSTKVVPVIATKVVPVIATKVTSVLATIITPKVILISASLAALLNIANKETPVPMNDREVKEDEDAQVILPYEADLLMQPQISQVQEARLDAQLSEKIEKLKTIDPEMYESIMRFTKVAESNGKITQEIEDFIKTNLDRLPPMDVYQHIFNAQSVKVKAAPKKDSELHEVLNKKELNEKGLSSVYAHSNNIDYRKRLKRYRFFIIFPGLDNNITCQFPAQDKYNVLQELPGSDKYKNDYSFPGSNKNNISIRLPGIKSPKYYCFDDYGGICSATIIGNHIGTNNTHDNYNNHVDSASYFDNKNSEFRKKCDNSPVSSEFKEMQLRGEIRELEVKLAELEEKLSFVSLLRVLKKRELRKQIAEIKGLLAEELTEILLTIKTADLDTARFELKMCEGNPYLYEIAQKVFDNRPENRSPVFYYASESELLEQINNTWSPLERVDLQQQIEDINQSKEVSSNKVEQTIDQEQICIIGLSCDLQELNIDTLKAKKN